MNTDNTRLYSWLQYVHYNCVSVSVSSEILNTETKRVRTEHTNITESV